jgi:hypothetical protein
MTSRELLKERRKSSCASGEKDHGGRKKLEKQRATVISDRHGLLTIPQQPFDFQRVSQ